MLVDANHLHDANELKIMLRKEFDMKYLDVAKKILGMEIIRNVCNPLTYYLSNLFKFLRDLVVI